MMNIDIINHVKGESQFVDDIMTPDNLLYASVAYSKIAHGKILKLDISNSKQIKGVKAIFTAEDIPGKNQIGGIIEDEELLSSKKVEFIGQPLALVIAEEKSVVNKAINKIKLITKNYLQLRIRVKHIKRVDL